MFTMPNLITLMRVPLAFLFLQDQLIWRACALILAMLSDCLDGLIARRWGQESRVGSFLDPMTDKFFVFSVLAVFLMEEKLSVWQAATMLCRDFSVLLFGCYLAWKGTLAHYQFRSILCGKITTTLQFTVLLCLLFGVAVPPFLYLSFVVFGALALVELYLDRSRVKLQS